MACLQMPPSYTERWMAGPGPGYGGDTPLKPHYQSFPPTTSTMTSPPPPPLPLPPAPFSEYHTHYSYEHSHTHSPVHSHHNHNNDYYHTPPPHSPHPTNQNQNQNSTQNPNSNHQLFSQDETTNLMGFLDNFNSDLDPSLAHDSGRHPRPPQALQLPSPHYQTQNQHYPTPVLPQPQSQQGGPGRPVPGLARRESYETHPPPPPITTLPSASASSTRSSRPTMPQRTHSSASSTASPIYSKHSHSSHASASANQHAISTPQKRMNHIMSEQKRRNAIREGYSTLIQLLSPSSGEVVIEMPTRGRPKGSGAQSAGRTRGKSGILFRAVEFTKWLEDGNRALRAEVERAEAAAGARVS